MVEIKSVKFEHYRDALGIGTGTPRISWSFEGTTKNWIQSSYEVEVQRPLKKSDLQIFKVESPDSVLVPWPSTTLVSRESAQVRVRATGSAACGILTTSWSKPVCVEVGIIHPADWSSSMIVATRVESPSGSLRPALFRKTFRLNKPLRSARLYITSYGVYEAQINGHRVGDHVLAPGWTSYTHRLTYQTFDVVELLQEGHNVIGAEVAEGWYCGRLGWNGGVRNIYGDKLGLFAQLEVVYHDGTKFVLPSDSSWKTSVGPRLSSELYDGETYDASLDRKGWSTSSFNDEDWCAVEELISLPGFASSEAPPVRVTEIIKAQQVSRSPSGKVLVDFGQNLVGWVRLRISGPKGTTITLIHTEVLEFGEAATRPLRACKATDRLILGDSEIEWEPKFTFHGFRYVQVEDWPSVRGEPGLADIEAVVFHTDMKKTGWFECSDPLVNQLHSNIRWGMRGNFVSIPTDCPQRDERLGWTGDIQVFTPTANFLYDTAGTLSGWLKDVAAEQIRDNNGVVPLVVPNILQYLPPGFDQAQAVWGDVAVLTPWDLYNSFGDIKVLDEQYQSMRAWLDHGIPRQKNGLWTRDTSPLGDWLDPDAPPDNPGGAKTNAHLVADAYLVHITSIAAKVSRILGHEKNAVYYASQASNLKRIWQETYIDPTTNLLQTDTMTSLSLALSFDLLPSTKIAEAASRLAQTTIDSKSHISTGFVGTPLICPTLTAHNLTSHAYRMLQTRTCPSWLYPVTMGATTMWERWDSMLPDGTINPGSMTSFNHYALGSVGAWLHATVGGIRAVEAGWKTVRFEPIPGGTITSAKIRFDGPYGMVECEWEVRDDGDLAGWEIIDSSSLRSPMQPSHQIDPDYSQQQLLLKTEDDNFETSTICTKELKFVMKATVPPNSRAEIKLPGWEEVIHVGSGIHDFTVDYVAHEM